MMTEDRGDVRSLSPPEVVPLPGYTQVVESAGERTVYVSGQVALNAAGKVVGLQNMEAQTGRSSRTQRWRREQSAQPSGMRSNQSAVRGNLCADTYRTTGVWETASVRGTRLTRIEHPPKVASRSADGGGVG